MTRKPWKVDYDGPSLPIITSSDPERFVVALVRTDEEDANLMAAAPEMYEALEAHEKYCETGLEADYNLFALMRDRAIAKAKGQS